jgi:hypothetical protein
MDDVEHWNTLRVEFTAAYNVARNALWAVRNGYRVDSDGTYHNPMAEQKAAWNQAREKVDEITHRKDKFVGPVVWIEKNRS